MSFDWKSTLKHLAFFAVCLFTINFALDFFGVKAWFYTPYTKLTGTTTG